MSLPRYPEYKDTGVEWIGKIPAHWDPAPLKRHVRLITDRATSRRRAIGLENVEGWSGRLIDTDGDFEGDGVAFEPGDVLFGKLRPYLAKVLAPDFPGEAVGDFHVLRPRGTLLPRYIQYQMLQSTFISVVDGSTFGSKMPRASWEALGGMLVMVPPSDEQAAIASFLDRETAKIDALIAEQEKLLALLAEKRHATISRLVTSGLDPSVPMKDSGIPSLGEVPAHWEVNRVRHAVTIDNGPRLPISREERVAMAGLYPYWGPTGIIDNIDHFRYQGQRALIGEDGDHFLKHSIWPMTQWATGRFNVNNHAHVIADGARCTARWFYFSFLYRDIGSDLIAQGVSRLKLTREGLSNLWLAVPPPEEQANILVHLDEALDGHNTLAEFAKRQVSLLDERRSGLIAAAVTGQIDVRHAAESQAA